MQARGRTAGTGRLGEPGAEGVGGAAAVITAGMRLHGASKVCVRLHGGRGWQPGLADGSCRAQRIGGAAVA
jgi:hypothetical protein